MPRHIASGLALIVILLLLAPPAGAVVRGTSSSLGSNTVRLVGPYYCGGVAIGSRLVVTAAHCARRSMRVLGGGGGSAGIASVSRSAVFDDGRHVSVSGDAAILKLSSPLSGVSAAQIGDGGGDTFTIAGYGTTNESARDAFGALHEATLVAGPGRQLVDPNRSGSISASACFGDSGGPVMRGGTLVGIITRANYPRKAIACGFYTRWAAITVSGEASAQFATEPASAADEPQPQHSRRHAKPKQEAETGSQFGNWFTEKTETRRHARKSTRHKEAQK